jgi:serine/threonine protein kinase
MISRIRAIHKKGLLHLDIKPNNFIFGIGKKNGNVLYLIDFGNTKHNQD